MTFAHLSSSNALRFSSIVGTISTSLQKELSLQKYSLHVIGGNDEKEFLQNELMSRFTTINWTTSADASITVTPTEMKTAYFPTEDDEALVRTCGMSATIRIDEPNKSRVLTISNITLSDTIRIDEVYQLQQPSYSFCIGAMPSSDWNALDSLVKPMLYVLTLGFSTWLLFSVRTQ
jgi:hypothetical protein